ncbi:hypothetical protein HELRODRAFT_174876 [Helobdella robusta]|uniref:Uncharacterized protein n=1 Tax=Helobdella robusta TaxID=6412 RepID=T1F8K2_HELRO|nr:hypothetical protein HELRODRAFT_174876 [Helobdella robusta]ESO01323.1 hypothetical protein HELRODRAFT_174876 [Helobdella robusta]
MSELHRARMTDMTEAQKMAMTAETSTREQLMQRLEEQKMNAKKVENQLHIQIEDMQLSMTRMEKEHSRREDGLKEEIADLQLVSSLRQDKARLKADLEMEKSKLGLLDENKHMLTAQKDAQIRKLEDELKDLKKEKILLENQLELEKMRVESERKKYNIISDQLREKDDYQDRLSAKSFSSENSQQQPHQQQQQQQRHQQITPTSSTSSMTWMSSKHQHQQSVYDSLRGLAQINDLERTRESLSRELVKVTVQNEELQDRMDKLRDIQQQYQVRFLLGPFLENAVLGFDFEW